MWPSGSPMVYLHSPMVFHSLIVLSRAPDTICSSRAESVKLAPATALQSAFYGVCQKGNKKNSSNTMPISQGQSGHPQDDMPSLWLPATISGILASTPGCC